MALVVASAALASGEAINLSKSQPVSFYQKAIPRELEGLAIRSDGRIISGPIMRELAGDPVANLWWDWESDPNGDAGWIGSGPDGHILRVELDLAGGVFASETWAETAANHIFVLKRLATGDLLAGGNPDGALLLVGADGETKQAATLPADSVFDILVDEGADLAWVATGNPALLFKVDLAKFSQSDAALTLAERGIERWGSVRDRNIRSLAFDAEGRVLAGSAPSGNLYRFDDSGAPPLILMDQESGEITDIHLTDSGDVLTTIIDAKGTARRRVMQSSQVQPTTTDEEEKKDDKPTPAPSIMEAPPVEKFSGRSELVILPGGDGLPETLSSRSNLAMYRIVPFAGGFLLPGGDDGELAGYDPAARRALTFAASNSAQLNDMTALPGGDQFLIMANNPATLSILDFGRSGDRRVQTSNLNLQTPSKVGALRFNRLRNIAPEDVTVEIRANRGRDAMEGWTPWTTAEYADGGWIADGLTGRTAQIAVSLPEDIAPGVELDQATLHFLPQNRRPVLRSFRIISPNFALRARSASNNTSATTTLSQVVNAPSPGGSAADKRRQALMSSPLVSEPGAQVVLWTVSDPDGDNLVATFSIRHQDDDTWQDLQVGTDADWFQFDRRTLAEGTYFTRLTVEETAPRPAGDRHSISFAADDLVIDLTPPEIHHQELSREGDHWRLEVSARDSYSLLSGMRAVFNNGYTASSAQPADGILDSPAETFVVHIPVDQLTSATQVEIYVEDTAANVATVRESL